VGFMPGSLAQPLLRLDHGAPASSQAAFQYG
jgi:hypothetical protein